MNNIFCPLCGGGNIKIIESIDSRDLNDLYKYNFNIEVMHLLKQKKLAFYICQHCALKFFDPSVIGDEYFYNILQETDLYYMDDKEEYEIAATFIKPVDDVLDIGCGKGAFARKIVCRSFIGLEFSTNAKEMAQDGGVTIINDSIQNYSILNKEKFSVVCAFQVLEHVDCSELLAFLKAAVDCIKDNGLLIISVPSEDSYVSKMNNNVLNMPPHHQTRWHDKTLIKIADILDLSLVNLHHDSISFRSKNEYLPVMVKYLLSTKHRLINRKPNIMQKVASRLLKLMSENTQHSIIDKIKPYGHSITAVYKKGFVIL